MFYSKLVNRYAGALHFWLFLSVAGLLLGSTSQAQSVQGDPLTPPGQAERLSGTRYLSAELQALQSDRSRNPATLWVNQGQSLLSGQCTQCHQDTAALGRSAATFPKLGASGHADGKTLIHLEDQLLRCQQRAGAVAKLEDASTLALSAALHTAAKHQPIEVKAPADASQAQAWQAHFDAGQHLYTRRIGRMNLACMHCHDERVGAQMRGDIISPGHPTGFPIYRLAWQNLGSLERRLRACYSGVQAPVPAYGSMELRQLELYLKVRAKGMPLEGAGVRR
jgi:L-cysteine S-thiosulfotransferase